MSVAPIRFIHTADLHLGAGYAFLPPEIAKLKKMSQQEGFANLVSRAIDERVDLFLIAGDVFDHLHPSKEQIVFFKKQLQRLKMADIYAFMISGNHDEYQLGGFWDDHQPWDARVFHTHDFESYLVSELDLQVIGIGFDRNQSQVNKLQNFDVEVEASRSILLFHGALQNFGFEVSRDYPFEARDIESLPVNYVALGHYHRLSEVWSKPTLKAYYSGDVEGLSFKKSECGARQAILGSIEVDGTVKVESVEIKGMVMEGVEVDMGMVTLAGLDSLFQEYSGPRQVVRMVLKGVPQFEVFQEIPLLEEHFGDLFGHLEVVDQTIGIPDSNLSQENTYRGRFYQAMKVRIDNASDEDEKRVLREAMAVGLGAFDR